MIQTISSPTSSFQTVIELVEALLIEEQDLLFSLVQKHRIVDRRQAILQRSIEAQTAFETGTAKVGTAEDAIADLFGTRTMITNSSASKHERHCRYVCRSSTTRSTVSEMAQHSGMKGRSINPS